MSRSHLTILVMVTLIAGCKNSSFGPAGSMFDRDPSTASTPPEWNSDNMVASGQPPLPGAQGQDLQNSDQILQASHEAASRNQLAEARAGYEQVIQMKSGHYIAHHRLAVVADIQKDFQTAERHYRLALAYAPDQPQLLGELYSDLGYSYLLQGRYPESEQNLKRSLEFNPGYSKALNNLGALYGTQGDYDQALAMFRSSGAPESDVQENLRKLFPNGPPPTSQLFAARPKQGQPMPGQPMPGQPMQGQPMQGQPMPGQPMPGQPSGMPASNPGAGSAFPSPDSPDVWGNPLGSRPDGLAASQGGAPKQSLNPNPQTAGMPVLPGANPDVGGMPNGNSFSNPNANAMLNGQNPMNAGAIAPTGGVRTQPMDAIGNQQNRGLPANGQNMPPTGQQWPTNPAGFPSDSLPGQPQGGVGMQNGGPGFPSGNQGSNPMNPRMTASGVQPGQHPGAAGQPGSPNQLPGWSPNMVPDTLSQVATQPGQGTSPNTVHGPHGIQQPTPSPAEASAMMAGMNAGGMFPVTPTSHQQIIRQNPGTDSRLGSQLQTPERYWGSDRPAQGNPSHPQGTPNYPQGSPNYPQGSPNYPQGMPQQAPRGTMPTGAPQSGQFPQGTNPGQPGVSQGGPAGTPIPNGQFRQQADFQQHQNHQPQQTPSGQRLPSWSDQGANAALRDFEEEIRQHNSGINAGLNNLNPGQRQWPAHVTGEGSHLSSQHNMRMPENISFPQSAEQRQ